MWDQVHIVIAIPTRYAVFAEDNISGCGYGGGHRGRGRSGDPQPDPAAGKRTSAWTKSTLGYPYRKGPRRDAAGLSEGRFSKRARELLQN